MNMKSYAIRWVVTIVMVAAAAPFSIWAQEMVFNFTVSGDQAVPPEETMAGGLGTVTLNAAQDEFTVAVNHSV